jgi:RNA polymerase sigma-70 factor (ECF subfamily)
MRFGGASIAMASEPLAAGRIDASSVARDRVGHEGAAEGRSAVDFAALYREHLPAVYRYLYTRLARREEAEDVASAAFARAWRSFGTCRESDTVRPWLFTIVRRSLADHYRHRRPTEQLSPEVADALPDESVGPEEAALNRERWRQVRTMLTTLGAEQQEILCLRFVADLSYGEIARVLGKREPAVKMAAYRALELLRRSYPDEG